MKNIYVIGLGVLGVLAWKRGKAKEVAKSAITEAEITDGTNWQGDMWDRLVGRDLVSIDFRNLTGSVNADPGRIGQAQLGLMPSWNGGL